ncbi:unnamed protein product [Pleuronectes platessa]|uniref:Uncharacterized protein n=1 Tax=Pleuronectes platessa TaxID=8262 RepID=A0A9N7U2V7_PLEPL|nr:unnamed protein product [Pleuronectes platessa]
MYEKLGLLLTWMPSSQCRSASRASPDGVFRITVRRSTGWLLKNSLIKKSWFEVGAAHTGAEEQQKVTDDLGLKYHTESLPCSYLLGLRNPESCRACGGVAAPEQRESSDPLADFPPPISPTDPSASDAPHQRRMDNLPQEASSI